MRNVDIIQQHWRLAAVYHDKARLAWGESRDALERLAARHETVANQLMRRVTR
ncbi:hypothetical protein [Vreelandella massiliensis]|uniref:hypothetical protein n=1 Tax=Vreelandella massiliensis TaxID=1816686 RepID=UPI0013562A12|nr:hypothetical protein [Halomonas massiliensis]